MEKPAEVKAEFSIATRVHGTTVTLRATLLTLGEDGAVGDFLLRWPDGTPLGPAQRATIPEFHIDMMRERFTTRFSPEELKATARPEEIGWAEEDTERVYFDLFEAVEVAIDSRFPEPWPEELKIAEYVPMRLKLQEGSVLERLLESLDEDYQHEDFYREQSDLGEMGAAERDLIRIVERDYRPTLWEVNGVVHTINCRDWIAEHRPSWLEEESNED